MFRTAMTLMVLATLVGCHSTHAPTTAPAAQTSSSADEKLWSLLRSGGQVVMMRHAKTTPGTGDPPNFKLGDCSTQRNLSDEGRAQAKAIGEAFARRGVHVGDVFSSQYCRCLDTARLVASRVDEHAELNSIPASASDRDARLAALRKMAGAKPNRDNTLLVTHQDNITALTGLVPPMGDMVIVTPDGSGGFQVAGQLHVAD